MAFHVIDVAPGLTASDRLEAVEAGPPAVEATDEYPALVAAAGFRDVAVRDESTRYRETAAAWLRESERNAADLEPLFGREAFRDQLARRRGALDAIDRGLLRRYLLLGRVSG